MVNWEYLKNNMTELNLSIIKDDFETPTDSILVLLNNVDTSSQGYFGLGIMTVVFLVLVFASFDKSGEIKLSILKSISVGSGFSTIIGLILIVSNIASSWVHVVWFFVIFVISIIGSYITKKKGL